MLLSTPILSLVSHMMTRTEGGTPNDQGEGNNTDTGENSASPNNGTGRDPNTSPNNGTGGDASQGSGDPNAGTDNDGGQSRPSHTDLLLKTHRDRLSAQGRTIKDLERENQEKDAEIAKLQANQANIASNGNNGQSDPPIDNSNNQRSGFSQRRNARQQNQDQAGSPAQTEINELYRQGFVEVAGEIEDMKGQVAQANQAVQEQQAATEKEKRVAQFTGQGIPEETATAIVESLDSDDYEERVMAANSLAEETEKAAKEAAKREREDNSRKSQLGAMSIATGAGGESTDGAGKDTTVIDTISEKPVDDQLAELERLTIAQGDQVGEAVSEEFVKRYLLT